MPEAINEYYNGMPIKTHHRYFVKFTRDREALFNTIARYQTLATNPLQLYYSGSLEPHKPPVVPHSILVRQQLTKSRRELAIFLHSMSVIDWQLLPDHNFSSVLLRLLVRGPPKSISP